LGYDVGDAVTVAYETRDEDDVLVAAASVVLTVTKPDLTTETPTVTPTETGKYESPYLFAAGGRYRFRWVSTDPNTAETFVVDVTGAGSNYPVLQDVKNYLNSTQADLAARYSDAVLTEVLEAEKADQAKRCRIPANYPTDLREALLRRCQRNLAMRGLSLAVLQGDADTGSSTFLPGRDPEVRRLEAGWPKVVLG
jgi:hypothetical protein